MEAVKQILAGILLEARARWCEAVTEAGNLEYRQKVAEREEREAAFAFRAVEMEILDPEKDMPSLEKLDQAHKEMNRCRDVTDKIKKHRQLAGDHLQNCQQAVNNAYKEFLKEP